MDDRRGGGAGKFVVGGGAVVVAIVVGLLTDQNPLTILAQMNEGQQQSAPSGAPPVDDEGSIFVKKVLGTTEDTWNKLLPGQYREPVLVLFRGQVASACGHATAAVGPFYCPGDEKAYLDLDFFDDLSRRFGAPGDFAAAYVIAHEIGHHVQKLDGTNARVARSGDRKGESSMGVRLELQADCYAGVWANDVKRRGILEVGDVEEAFKAAESIGDDTLQKKARGKVMPDSFTHGSSAQRLKWFNQGLESGDPKTCDTFSAAAL